MTITGFDQPLIGVDVRNIALNNQLLPQLLGENPLAPAQLNYKTNHLMNGHPYIKSAIDMTCWDIPEKASGLTIATLTGGHYGTGTPLYRPVSQSDPQSMADQATAHVNRGYRRIQVKTGDDPVEDTERMRAVRSCVGSDILLIADANGGWTVDEALRFINLMGWENFYLEKPCFTLAECAKIRPHCRQPLILDESINNLADLIAASESGIANGVSLKISRLRGITQTGSLRDVAVSYGLKVSIEDTGGSDINTATTAHLMQPAPERSRFHTVDFMNWVSVKNATGMPPALNRTLSAPCGPGLGIEVL
jgi:cis-L-3-hydroxyproline dehydratase